MLSLCCFLGTTQLTPQQLGAVIENAPTPLSAQQNLIKKPKACEGHGTAGAKQNTFT